MNTLKHNPWKRVAFVEEGGITQTTEAMDVLGCGVLVRNTTLVNGPNTVNQSTVYVPDCKLHPTLNGNGFYDIVGHGLRS